MAKVKTVFKPSELIHAWAHGVTTDGRTPTRNHREDWRGCNPRKVVTLFVTGTVLYSYGEHYALANRIEVPEYNIETLHHYRTDKPMMEPHEYTGSVVYLVNEEKSTVTTEGYKNEVIRGIPSYLKYFVVPYVNTGMDEHWHDKNIQWYAKRCNELWKPKARERKGLVARRIREYIKIASEMQAYCLIFKSEHWVNEKVDTMLIPAPIRHAQKALEEALPAEREYNAKLAEARNKKHSLTREEREQRKRNNEAERINKKVARFRSGAHSESFTDADGCALLNVQGDTVFTSMGARFPATHAAKALRMLRLMLNARIPVMTYERAEEPGKPFEVYYERGEHSVKLGYYTIDKVTNEAQAGSLMGEYRSWVRYTVSDADAMIYAGCHRVKWSEVLLNEAAIMEAAKEQSEVSE